jgi:TonB family protein
VVRILAASAVSALALSAHAAATPALGETAPQAPDPAWHMLDAPLPATTQVPPDYPGRAWTQGIEGVCDVQVFVDREGRVDDAYTAACPAVFEDAAVAAALGWRFEPHEADGTSLRSTFELPFHFRLSR